MHSRKFRIPQLIDLYFVFIIGYFLDFMDPGFWIPILLITESKKVSFFCLLDHLDTGHPEAIGQTREDSFP